MTPPPALPSLPIPCDRAIAVEQVYIQQTIVFVSHARHQNRQGRPKEVCGVERKVIGRSWLCVCHAQKKTHKLGEK